jgi:hypothetical protein
MFVWILILIPWVALLSLILHDATKEDSNGSAILDAANNLNALIFWARKKSVSNSAKVATAIKAVSLASRRSGRGEIKQTRAPPAKKQWWSKQRRVSSKPGGRGEIKQAPAPSPKKQWGRKERRVSMTTPELELAILEAVKKAAPGCEDFVGVVVAHETPKSHPGSNWAIRGVKFGKADRTIANEALDGVVEGMQREFRLSEDESAPRSNRRT